MSGGGAQDVGRAAAAHPGRLEHRARRAIGGVNRWGVQSVLPAAGPYRGCLIIVPLRG